MISIIIPTMNRPQFVQRLLSYYAKQKFPYSIFIGDSSVEPYQREVESCVKNFCKTIEVSYVACPGLNNYEVIQALMEKTKAPYISYLADDDFLIPETLKECLEFMEKNPGYSGALGKALLFKLRSDGAYGPFEATHVYPEYNLESDAPKKRLLNHVENYSSVFHGVCRKEMFKKALRNIEELKAVTTKEFNLSDKVEWFSHIQFSELLTSWSMVIQGKIKRLDSLHYVRQVHDARYLFPDWYDWITAPNWNRLLEIFRERVLQDLIEAGYSAEEGPSIFKELFFQYLAKRAAHRLLKSKRNPGKMALKNYLKNFLFVQSAWRQILSVTEEMSLESLLRESSAHHQRFMPIYQLITKEN